VSIAGYSVEEIRTSLPRHRAAQAVAPGGIEAADVDPVAAKLPADAPARGAAVLGATVDPGRDRETGDRETGTRSVYPTMPILTSSPLTSPRPR
jgi:hypothetical protein